MRLITFILKNRVIKTDDRDLTPLQIEGTKRLLSFMHSCTPNDIDVIFEERDFSEYDVGVDGMYKWTDTYPTVISGVGLPFKKGSDEHLDAILNNTLEKHLIFI